MGFRKITFIGGGSYQWVPTLFRDIAVNPALREGRFVLHDIDPERNAELANVCRVIGRKVGANIEVETELDLDRSLEGAEAVVLCISTGGLEAMEHDVEIPKKYGIYQPVGDSTGPGGISRTLRNVPVVTAIASRMEALCPDAWLLNLTNPMDQIVYAVSRTSKIKVVGLCHEFMGFMGTLERILGLTDWRNEISVKIAGINHFAWVLEASANGRDAFPPLRDYLKNVATEHAAESGPANGVNLSQSLSGNHVKFALFETFGAVPYPGDRHLVEYFPYFLSEKTRHGMDFGVLLTSIEDRKGAWMTSFKERIAEWTSDVADSVPLEPSAESLAPILAALIGGGPSTVQPATLMNTGQVENLPLGSSVETLATFDSASVSPHASGPLPLPILGLVHKHCLIQDLTVEGALKGDRDVVLQAMLADPLNNNNDFREIGRMLDELLAANAVWLPQFHGKRPG